MKIKVKVAGIKDVKEKLGRARRRSGQALRNTVVEIAEDSVRLARESIQTGGRSGRVYTIRGKVHQASAAGEPPAELFGGLASSLGYSVGPTTKKVTASVYADLGIAPYARVLELGGLTGAGRYIAPRPYLQPAVQEAFATAEDRLKTRMDVRP